MTSWYSMAAARDALGDACDGEMFVFQPREDQVNGVSGVQPGTEPRRERPAGQGRLECEAHPPPGELVEAREHRASGGDCNTLGSERGQALGDLVGVDEF